MASKKDQHEAFVSGLNGTTVLEITTMATLAPALVLLRNCLAMLLFGVVSKASLRRFSMDFIILVFPLLMLFTILNEHAFTTLVLLISVVITLLLLVDKRSGDSESLRFDDLLNTVMLNKRPYITYFRSYVNIATAIAILSVDFDIYPRRFCKVETYGTGVMDAGVGAFVVANAIVSPEARGKSHSSLTLRGTLHYTYKSVVSSIPLIVLGFVRVVSVKSVDYQEHASEYGIYWNFFFTLAVVKIMSSILLCVFNVRYIGVLGIAVAVGYQYCLSELGLNKIVLHGIQGDDSRVGFINANREGLFSSIGYCALYCVGVQLGQYLFQSRSRLKDWLWVFVTLSGLVCVFWILLIQSERYLEPVSRRVGNLSFVIWMLQYNVHTIAAFLLVDILTVVITESGVLGKLRISERRETFCLLDAVNKNGLFYFLLANLLTGLVNLSVNTLEYPPFSSCCILSLYMFALSLIATVFKIFNVYVKFW